MPNLLRKLSSLNIDRAKGAAPHKPLLLLCLLEIAAEGGLTEEIMPVTGELAFRFAGYWSVVVHRRPNRPEIKLPLFHMKSAGFWQPLDAEQKIMKYRDLPAYIQFDPAFLAAFNDPAFREQARAILIGTYFESHEQATLWALTGGAPPSAESLTALTADTEAVERGREGRFRIGVVTAYNYTCALTGYRLVTLTSGTIVDACHIHQFSHSRNNDPTNGIALCKNAHWLFDNGLWSLRDDYTILTADRHFSEAGEAALLLGRMKGKQITLPTNDSYWPGQQHLEWHRKHKFLGN
ncbi:MAG TPA: HNH endonuclease [Dongiaceae bacterium]|nr:HNH endonuclease [Dongiaceae bacterium]